MESPTAENETIGTCLLEYGYLGEFDSIFQTSRDNGSGARGVGFQKPVSHLKISWMCTFKLCNT
jgi:hypothetical protein